MSQEIATAAVITTPTTDDTPTPQAQIPWWLSFALAEGAAAFRSLVALKQTHNLTAIMGVVRQIRDEANLI